MDMRYEMRGDGRRLPPRNSRGEFTRRGGRGRSRRMDRGMDYGYDMRGDMRGRGRNDYGNYEMDGHYGGMHGGKAGGYEPVEFMGYCSGYYGSPESDYGRGDMNYRNYDMRGRDYGYPMYDMRGGRDYGYGDYGDYGETLSDKELEKWCEKLKKNLDDQEKQMFHKDMISQKAKQMGMQMEGFGEKELIVTTMMLYDDYKKTLGRNPDVYIKLAYDWLNDQDSELKGAQKLAVYHDDIVMGGED